ncbi:MAG: acetyl-CoA decarbonylase/synthase complex subunit delta [Methanomassiliicoccales archaeon]|uniref:acetyl-CoA decarbonylase/synthase complex subunit delta n=1 Tax=Candidatus Methanarcanum hacksteinii TaxID=2911857 RepID=UPI00270061F0|nr:acetyl-CoA decarbonylase/synthase complex subunit delta [Methanomassiliicoccales archaeon]MDD7478351.1 acetyl-CoA decarbonylase/synthase complex subunit delta [Methanomassiliicoccales archaeon]MDO5837328.1 acetyl-CoA decarbonylase/synthase complex subunit delta [Methanomassiliicoccales archaeon]MDY4580366.1 acetyl-CoA decarbonylase/synthase complex subunit delta [Candidatus Methanarcanum hacksteinii]TQS76830.1 MAG: hypothetical protein A3204_05415 [Candidatus Methanarcanum hacksteinii]
MTEIPNVSEKYNGETIQVALGKGDYVAGGAKGMPFLSFENPNKLRPMIAGEVWDDITDYPEIAKEMFSGRCDDPVEWATMWKELGADIICIRLMSIDPFKKNASADDAATLVQRIVDKTNLPVMVSGCGNVERDIEVLTVVCEKVKNTRLLINKVEEGEYKKLATAAMANNHVIIGFSNLDVNLAKQMNILLSDFGVETNNMLMDPLMAALGMGLDYSYSVNERIKLSAYSGDKMLQIPMICDCTSSWDVGDATEEDDGTMGPASFRATWWEAITGMAAMVSGADILVVRGPGAADMLKVYACELTEVM